MHIASFGDWGGGAFPDFYCCVSLTAVSLFFGRRHLFLLTVCYVFALFTALYSLNVEQCSITSRTVQKMTDALHEESVLSHLSLGTSCFHDGLLLF